MLNLLGLIPGIGDVFDITNAIWYASEGNWGRCFEAGIAALPFIGNLLPDRRTCDYVRRALNIVSYGGTGFLAGQGMVDGGKALWAEINSGQCSGWSIFLGVANIGLNGATLFFSGKGFVQETGNLNKMLKADGVYDRLYDEVVRFHNNNGGYLNTDAFSNTKFKWGNSKSIPTYGHTFSEHGQKITTQQMIDRANGFENPHQVGQWLDNQQAADFLADVVINKKGVLDINLPSHIKARVLLPNGTEIIPDKAIIVLKPDGSIRTAYPYSSLYPTN